MPPLSRPPQGGPHLTQFTGSMCAGRNCAATAAARALAYTTGGAVKLTPDQFRHESGASCIPGAHSPSGGLFPSDVIRVFSHHGARIDYGNGWNAPGMTRRAPAAIAKLLTKGYMAVLVGDYGTLPADYDKDPGFNDDHSATGSDYRGIFNPTAEWDDPIVRSGLSAPVRMLWPIMVRYAETLNNVRHSGMLVGMVEPPHLAPNAKVVIDPGHFFIYTMVSGVAAYRRSQGTEGFGRPCTKRSSHLGIGGRRWYAQILTGSYNGQWVWTDSPGIHYSE